MEHVGLGQEDLRQDLWTLKKGHEDAYEIFQHYLWPFLIISVL